jgi:sRNA-binding carbon storage regulator CsrA
MALKTLILDVRVGETVSVSGPASFKVESKSGNSTRLAVMADESVKITRPTSVAAQQAQQGIKRGRE